eukprot:TRINITY_DN931_c0_g1_i1.p1 TRINITY_DN931_c0_g1~~TRINITY_DN931_c0_g1_i1.p1  ORF type:complete len:407 (+),score=119.81 TRINITY_DN931_c0_g1_i1:31-1251(+)
MTTENFHPTSSCADDAWEDKIHEEILEHEEKVFMEETPMIAVDDHHNPEDEDVELPEISEVDHKDYELPASISNPSYAEVVKIKKVLLLFNPHSGAEEGVKLTEEAVQLLEKRSIQVDKRELKEPGHAEEIVKTANLDDVDVVATLGGDGTFHEAVNGMMKRPEGAKRVPLAFVAGGTGNSFALELHGGVEISDAIDHLVRGLSVPIDIGKTTWPLESGEDELVYSFNSIHWGLASKVNVTAEKLRWMGKAIRYTTASMLEMVKGAQTRAKVSLTLADDKKISYDEDFCLIIVNNIISAGKGMKMAPNAKINDGLFDAIIIRSNAALDLATVFKGMYDGTHVDTEQVEYKQVKGLSIIPFKKDEPAKVAKETDPDEAEEVVDIDGELKGSTPFTCTVLPRALRVII